MTLGGPARGEGIGTAVAWAAIELHFPVVADPGQAADRRGAPAVPVLEDVGAVAVGEGFADDHRPKLRRRRLSRRYFVSCSIAYWTGYGAGR